MKKSLQAILTSLLFLVGAQASASVVVIDGGPVWGTGPIDVTNTSSGAGVTQGGQTHNYTNAASSPGTQMVFFGLWSGGGWGFSGNGPGISGAEAYSWYADTSTSIEYRGQTSVPTATGGAYQLFTRLVMTANAGASVITDPVTQGIAGGVHSLFMLTGGTFSVTREVELSQDGINWFDAKPYYDSLTNKLAGNSFQSNLSTGFYWQNAVADPGRLPEPASLSLAAAGLIALGALRRGRRRA